MALPTRCNGLASCAVSSRTLVVSISKPNTVQTLTARPQNRSLSPGRPYVPVNSRRCRALRPYSSR